MSNVRLLIAGCAGRMGRALLKEALANPRTDLAGGLEQKGAAALGADLGLLAGLAPVGLLAGDRLEPALAHADVLIDFSAAAAAATHARAAAAHGRPVVLGVTGLTPEDEAEVAVAAKSVPVVRASNFSLGVALVAALVEEAARRLHDDFDIEIVETHHRDKVDAPSGTALALGEAAARGRGIALSHRAVRTRDGQTGPRHAGDIGFAVRRGGGVIGDHEVSFMSGEEIVTLSHRALDRSLFARGAVAAAIWAHGKKPGLYDMRDVLGL